MSMVKKWKAPAKLVNTALLHIRQKRVAYVDGYVPAQQISYIKL